MYTLDQKPVTIVRRWIVNEGTYAGQEFAEILCDGERDYIPFAWIATQPEPRQPHPSDAMQCHYCGMPAYGFGFFDEPACGECGGK